MIRIERQHVCHGPRENLIAAETIPLHSPHTTTTSSAAPAYTAYTSPAYTCSRNYLLNSHEMRKFRIYPKFYTGCKDYLIGIYSNQLVVQIEI